MRSSVKKREIIIHIDRSAPVCPPCRTRAVSWSFRDGRDAPRQTERTGGRGAATARRYVRQRRSDDDWRERRASEVQVRAIRVSGRARVSRRSHRTLFRHILRGASFPFADATDHRARRTRLTRFAARSQVRRHRRQRHRDPRRRGHRRARDGAPPRTFRATFPTSRLPIIRPRGIFHGIKKTFRAPFAKNTRSVLPDCFPDNVP